MKKFLILCSILAAASTISLQAQTIVSGGEGSLTYVGDFGIGVSMTQSGDEYDQAFLDDGWISTDSVWIISDGQAVPDGSGNTNESVAIAFASSIDGTYTLSFDYKLTGGANNTTREPGWGLYGITDSAAFTLGMNLNDNWTGVDYSTLTGGGLNASGLTTLLSENYSNNPATSSHSGSISQTFTADSTTYDGYLFLANSASPGGLDGEFIDNVAITVVPEPSTAALLLGCAGLALVLRRRRRALI